MAVLVRDLMLGSVYQPSWSADEVGVQTVMSIIGDNYRSINFYRYRYR